MIDTAKRKTLKKIGLSAAASAVSGLSLHAIAAPSIEATSQFEVNDQPLADIHVNTRVSSATNDIEVLITNAGDQTTRITQMTPSETSTQRGRFDFGKLMANGDLTLAPGQSVTVPMTPNALLPGTSATAGQSAKPLDSALRSAFSVITENKAYARVTIGAGVRYI